MPFLPNLNVKRKKFVEEYALLGNAKQAAIRAGYSPKTAEFQASRLLKDAEVKKYLHTLLEEATGQTIIEKRRVLKSLWNIAEAKMTNVAKWNNGELELINSDSLEEAENMAIQEVCITGGKTPRKKIKMQDKVTALSKLLSHYEKMEELEAQAKNKNDSNDNRPNFSKVAHTLKKRLNDYLRETKTKESLASNDGPQMNHLDFAPEGQNSPI